MIKNPYVIPGLPVRLPPRFPNIVEAVCNYYEVTINEIKSQHDRHKVVTEPRFICIYFINRYTYLTWRQIASYFDYGDHTSAIHAVKSVRAWLDARDERTVAAVNAIEDILLKDNYTGNA